MPGFWISISRISKTRICKLIYNSTHFRSSHLEVFLGKGVLKIWSKFTGEHLCQSVNSIKLQSNFIEITLRYGCSPVNLLHIFRTPFSKNSSGRLLLTLYFKMFLSTAFYVLLILSSPKFHFYTPWDGQKTFGFLKFPGGYRNGASSENGLRWLVNTFHMSRML